MIIVIDNYDSFVYNLCDYIGRVSDKELEVCRNDAESADEILKKKPDAVIVSPGPGTPEEAGISIDLIKKLPPGTPLLGVCLGHQALAAAFGGKVVRAKRIIHGKVSLINHKSKDIFEGLKNPFEATRYHSLIVDRDSLPRDLEITAETGEHEIMGLRHKTLPLFGVQFHPESILTEEGLNLIENFIKIIK
jgi:anthranilate synthase component 2